MLYLFSDDMCPQQLDSHVDHKQPTEEQDIQDLFWPQGHKYAKHSQEPAQQCNPNQDKHVNTGTDTPDHYSKLVLLVYL